MFLITKPKFPVSIRYRLRHYNKRKGIVMDVREKARYIKTIIFSSVNDIKSIEKTVNETVDKLKENGGKVVSIIPHSWGISPMNLLYDIVYESYEPINF